MKIWKNKYFKILSLCGVTLFAVISYVIIRSTSTVSAVVPNQEIAAGTRLDASMLQTIRVPSNTPKGYITDVSSLVGQKLKVNVSENQLMYINDVMSSWDDFSSGESIPEDYVITSIQLPSNRAVGGLVTPGDVVDILGVPNQNYDTTSKETLANYLGEIADESYGADGIQTYWILSNVKILETDSTLSQSNNASISAVTQEDDINSNNGSFYIIALSYEDYQKLRLCEQYLDLWMNIAPEQNEENGPLLDQMKGSTLKALQDAQAQSHMKKVETEEKKNEN